MFISNSVTNIGNYAFNDCNSLTDIYSYNPYPPSLGKTFTFDEHHYQNATLYVPQEALEAYKAAEEWKEFQNIKGIDPTGINGVEADGNNKPDVYYDLNGRRLDAPRKGINIINGKKVVVK